MPTSKAPRRPTLVLIPGLMCDAGVFRALVPELSRRRDLLVADVTQDASIASMARRIAERVRGPMDVLGFSMGGMVAMELVRRWPSRVTRLALLDTNDAADTPAVRAWRASLIERVASGELMDVMRYVLVPRYVVADRLGSPALVNRCLRMAMALGPAVFARQFSALATRRDQHEALRNYEGAALVLRGRDDTLCDEAAHRRIASALRRSRTVEIDGAAHLSVLERPFAVVKAVNRWLESQAQEAPPYGWS